MHRQKQHKRKLNKREVTRIIERYKSGCSLAQISRQMGIHEDTTRRVLSAQNKISKELLGGVSIIIPQFALTEEDHIAIEKAVSDGASFHSLSKRYGVSIETVRRSCDRVRVARGETSLAERRLLDRSTHKPLKLGEKRETIFTWAKRWEAEFDERAKA